MSDVNFSNITYIDHTKQLSKQLENMLKTKDYTDVVFDVQGVKFEAHKSILASRSSYFKALLFGGMMESKREEVFIRSTPPKAFGILLSYIYSGVVPISALHEDVVLDVLGLANLYGFSELECGISEYLIRTLTVETCCSSYDCGLLYNLQKLVRASAIFIDQHTPEVINHKSFFQLSHEAVKCLIKRDSFFANEIDIFHAVRRWMEENNEVPESAMVEILLEVRFSLMTYEELFTQVRPTKLVCADRLLDAIFKQFMAEGHDCTTQQSSKRQKFILRHRGLLCMEKNMARKEEGALVLQGEMRSSLLDDTPHAYNAEHGFTRHVISDNVNSGILIKLGTQCIVNHISMLLWDNDFRAYSYFIEVSIDQKHWVRVIDYRQYFCRSKQTLFFEPRVVRFIHIVGTHNTMNRVFHLVRFKIMYTNQIMPTIQDLIVPKVNVARAEFSATVVDGVCRSRNSLLDGNTTTYDWDSGYTCHQLQSGCIVVQLGQPFVIGSIRMLLWDCDERTYSYRIESSISGYQWDLLVDNSEKECQSWQTLTFKERPIVFVRITGTKNTANEVFHVVHFECPVADLESIHPPSPSPELSDNEFPEESLDNNDGKLN